MNYSQVAEYVKETGQHNGFIKHIGEAENPQTEVTERGSSLVLIVDKRELERECLARGLVEHNSNLSIAAIGSADDFRRMPNGKEVSAALVVLNSRRVTDEDARLELERLVSELGSVPILIIADSDEPTEILAALEVGARGYIPTSVKVKVAAEAIALACAGGIFVPANALLALREMVHTRVSGVRPLADVFTVREATVIEAMRKGKANKIIAYELNLCESTVKVHVRNIMKKLKATNRTEVAYKLQEMGL